MKEKKHWNRRVLSFFLALAMVITQLGVWNAGKESVQAADTVIYQENFSESTDGWTPEWSVGSDLTTFAVGKNYAKDNDSSLNIWSKNCLLYTSSRSQRRDYGQKISENVTIHNICFWMKKNFTLTYLFGGG